jgi:hypothetical protein
MRRRRRRKIFANAVGARVIEGRFTTKGNRFLQNSLAHRLPDGPIPKKDIYFFLTFLASWACRVECKCMCCVVDREQVFHKITKEMEDINRPSGNPGLLLLLARLFRTVSPCSKQLRQIHFYSGLLSLHCFPGLL